MGCAVCQRSLIERRTAPNEGQKPYIELIPALFHPTAQ
jgi:hypothetical protein